MITLFLFYFIISRLGEIIDLMRSLFSRFRIDSLYLETVFQIVGIAYLTELDPTTKDAILNSISSKIELVGNINYICIIPILTAIIETIIHLLP